MARQVLEAADVVGSTIAIPGISGGLNQGLKIQHREFAPGERIFTVLEAVIVDVGFKAVDRDDPTGPKRRHHVCVVEASTFASAAEVGELIAKQKARLALAKDEESGQGTIDHSAELELRHFAGKHKRLTAGCPSCEKEKDLAAAEKASTQTAKAEARAERQRQSAAKKRGDRPELSVVEDA